MYDCVALESHASDKQLNLIIFDLEVSVFYNFYKKMNLFVKIVGLCRPTHVFFITFVNGILETEYRNSVNSGKLLLVPYTKDFGIITRF